MDIGMTSDSARHPDNKTKNRYVNVLACEWLTEPPLGSGTIRGLHWGLGRWNQTHIDVVVPPADDHSRVRLSTQTDSGQTGDYINANYVDVRNRFILSDQGSLAGFEPVQTSCVCTLRVCRVSTSPGRTSRPRARCAPAWTTSGGWCGSRGPGSSS